MSAARVLIIALLVFCLGYYEDLAVGAAKFGVIWKAVLIVVLGLALGRHVFRPSRQMVVGTALVLKTLVYSYAGMQYFLLDISEAVKFLVLPISVEYFLRAPSGERKTGSCVVFLAWFLPLAGLPFFLGLPAYEYKETHSLSIYGAADAYEFAGIFGNKHNASVILSAAVLLVYHLWRLGAVSFLAFLGLELLALYGLYLTYARTGILALVSGLLIYALMSRRPGRALGRAAAFLTIVVFAGFLAWSNSETFRLRLVGQNIYSASASVDSGRLSYWEAAFDAAAESEPLELLIGVGLEASKDALEREFGLRIFAHNGFLDALRANGLIGLTLFVIYWGLLWRFARRFKGSVHYALAISLLAHMVLVQVIQGGHFIWNYVLIACVLSLLRNRARTVEGPVALKRGGGMNDHFALSYRSSN